MWKGEGALSGTAAAVSSSSENSLLKMEVNAGQIAKARIHKRLGERASLASFNVCEMGPVLSSSPHSTPGGTAAILTGPAAIL